MMQRMEQPCDRLMGPWRKTPQSGHPCAGSQQTKHILPLLFWLSSIDGQSQRGQVFLMNNFKLHIFLILIACSGCSELRIPTQPKLLSIIAKPSTPVETVRVAAKVLEPGVEPTSFWADIANGSSYPATSRQIAILQMFRRHFDPSHGTMSIGEIGRQMKGAKWLRIEDVHVLPFLVGSIPISLGAWDVTKSTVVYVDVLPQADPKHIRRMYLLINRVITVEQLFCSFIGRPVDGDEARMVEVGSVESEKNGHWQSWNQFGLEKKSNSDRY